MRIGRNIVFLVSRLCCGIYELKGTCVNNGQCVILLEDFLLFPSIFDWYSILVPMRTYQRNEFGSAKE